MSTPILAEPDTTGWLLEMTGTDWATITSAIKPGGDIIGIVHASIHSSMDWCISAVPGLPTAYFREYPEAVAWLCRLAELVTRPGVEAVTA